MSVVSMRIAEVQLVDVVLTALVLDSQPVANLALSATVQLVPDVQLVSTDQIDQRILWQSPAVVANNVRVIARTVKAEAIPWKITHVHPSIFTPAYSLAIH